MGPSSPAQSALAAYLRRHELQGEDGSTVLVASPSKQPPSAAPQRASSPTSTSPSRSRSPSTAGLLSPIAPEAAANGRPQPAANAERAAATAASSSSPSLLSPESSPGLSFTGAGAYARASSAVRARSAVGTSPHAASSPAPSSSRTHTDSLLTPSPTTKSAASHPRTLSRRLADAAAAPTPSFSFVAARLGFGSDGADAAGDVRSSADADANANANIDAAVAETERRVKALLAGRFPEPTLPSTAALDATIACERRGRSSRRRPAAPAVDAWVLAQARNAATASGDDGEADDGSEPRWALGKGAGACGVSSSTAARAASARAPARTLQPKDVGRAASASTRRSHRSPPARAAKAAKAAGPTVRTPRAASSVSASTATRRPRTTAARARGSGARGRAAASVASDSDAASTRTCSTHLTASTITTALAGGTPQRSRRVSVSTTASAVSLAVTPPRKARAHVAAAAAPAVRSLSLSPISIPTTMSTPPTSLPTTTPPRSAARRRQLFAPSHAAAAPAAHCGRASSAPAPGLRARSTAAPPKATANAASKACRPCGSDARLAARATNGAWAWVREERDAEGAARSAPMAAAATMDDSAATQAVADGAAAFAAVWAEFHDGLQSEAMRLTPVKERRARKALAADSSDQDSVATAGTRWRAKRAGVATGATTPSRKVVKRRKQAAAGPAAAVAEPETLSVRELQQERRRVRHALARGNHTGRPKGSGAAATAARRRPAVRLLPGTGRDGSHDGSGADDAVLALEWASDLDALDNGDSARQRTVPGALSLPHLQAMVKVFRLVLREEREAAAAATSVSATLAADHTAATAAATHTHSAMLARLSAQIDVLQRNLDAILPAATAAATTADAGAAAAADKAVQVSRLATIRRILGLPPAPGAGASTAGAPRLTDADVALAEKFARAMGLPLPPARPSSCPAAAAATAATRGTPASVASPDTTLSPEQHCAPLSPSPPRITYSYDATMPHHNLTIAPDPSAAPPSAAVASTASAASVRWMYPELFGVGPRRDAAAAAAAAAAAPTAAPAPSPTTTATAAIAVAGGDAVDAPMLAAQQTRVDTAPRSPLPQHHAHHSPHHSSTAPYMARSGYHNYPPPPVQPPASSTTFYPRPPQPQPAHPTQPPPPALPALVHQPRPAPYPYVLPPPPRPADAAAAYESWRRHRDSSPNLPHHHRPAPFLAATAPPPSNAATVPVPTTLPPPLPSARTDSAEGDEPAAAAPEDTSAPALAMACANSSDNPALSPPPKPPACDTTGTGAGASPPCSAARSEASSVGSATGTSSNPSSGPRTPPTPPLAGEDLGNGRLGSAEEEVEKECAMEVTSARSVSSRLLHAAGTAAASTPPSAAKPARATDLPPVPEYAEERVERDARGGLAVHWVSGQEGSPRATPAKGATCARDSAGEGLVLPEGVTA